mgnify:CR=1 FL=1
MIIVQARLFSLVRYALNTSNVEIKLEDGSTVENLLENIIAMKPEKLNGLPIRVAVNKEYAEEHHILQNQDEVALIPPVSGG